VKPGKNITKELQDIAPTLAKLDKTNFYQVEEGYFGGASLKIIELIEKPVHTEIVPPVLCAVRDLPLYAAPAPDYFESFADRMMKMAHAEEVAEELSYALPILEHVEKKSLYAVPATYFASFPKAIVKLVSKEETESSVSHWAHVWEALTEAALSLISRPRYAFVMASVMSVIVCVGLVVNTQSSLSGDDKIFAQMQQIPDAELHHYISKHRDEFDERTILTNINNVDFTHYFDRPDQVTPHIESHSQGQTEEEINENILD